MDNYEVRFCLECQASVTISYDSTGNVFFYYCKRKNCIMRETIRGEAAGCITCNGTVEDMRSD